MMHDKKTTSMTPNDTMIPFEISINDIMLRTSAHFAKRFLSPVDTAFLEFLTKSPKSSPRRCMRKGKFDPLDMKTWYPACGEAYEIETACAIPQRC